MGWLKEIKWKLMRFLGIKPSLKDIVLHNLQEKQNKDFVPTPTPIARKCGYHACKKRLKGLTYKCPYCKKTYCERHRLPEEHNCPSPQLPREMRIGYGTKQKSALSGRFGQAERN
jgi:hypothetical protein